MSTAHHRLICATMAGGSGTRFWPLSRRMRPKQLIRLLDDRTLLRNTFERLLPICPPERQLIITAARLADAVRAELPELPAGHIVGEPVPRNTAPCMAVAGRLARSLDPDAILALLPADHHIGQPERFRAALARAAEEADSGHIVTLGVVPTRPETGYGYIERASDADGEDAASWDVVRFVEKPDLPTALTYLQGGRHLWNAGVFVLRADVAMAAISRHLPEIDAALASFDRAAPTPADPALPALLAEGFGRCPSVSVDYGVMEHETNLRVVPLQAGWSDVGSWSSLIDERPEGAANFVRGDVQALETTDCVLVGEGVHLSVVGLQGLAVVATPDAVLALPLDRAQDVRAVVAGLEAAGRDEVR